MTIQVEITTTEVGITEQVTTLAEIAGAGPQGPRGDAATIDVGQVTAVNPDQQPNVTNVGTTADAVLDFDLPLAPAFEVGDVVQVGPDDPLVITNSGTDGNIKLDFQIPQGQPGIGLLPTGGATNALLTKLSPADSDSGWTNVPTVYGLQLDTAEIAADATGRIVWDDGDQVPSFVSNGVKVRLGLETLARCRNVTGQTIPKGTAVCIVGASANRISIAPSDRTQPGSACRTLGVTLQNIPNNQLGKVSTFGLVRGLNTSAFQEGDELFVGPTPGSLTATPPPPGVRRLIVGYAVTINPSQGQLFVTLRRGLRVSEIDDTDITTPANGEVLRFDNGLWVNDALGTAADANVGDFDPAGSASSVQSNLTSHINDTQNPHQTTATQVGLGNVDNTADLDKPVSTATQTALNAKADKSTQIIAGTGLAGGGDLSTNRTIDLNSATVASLGKADTATQPGDNVSTLTNDAAYINAAGAPVQSVNTQTGTVVLGASEVGADPAGSAAGVQSNLDSHTGATTNVHGIADTSQLIVEGDARLTNERVPTDGSVTDAKVATTANIAQSKISGLTASLDAKANLVNGKVPVNELPAIAITETYVVADIAARDALTPDKGDVAIVLDRGDGQPASYIYDGTSWQKLLTPLKGVSAVTATAPISSTGGDTPTISLNDLGVTTAKLDDGAVTDAKVSATANIAPSKILGTAVVDNDARLTDQRTPLDGSVTDAKIASGGLSPTSITGTAVVTGDARLSEGAANTETVRSLGTGSTQALPGDFDIAGQAPVQSVNTKTGTVTLTASDVGAYADTNPSNFVDAAGAAAAAPVQSVAGKTGAVTLAKADVGLGNVDNTSDLDKPISTATQTALNAKADNARLINTQDGIEGGGDLSANRTLKLTSATLASLGLADTALQSGAAATAIAYDNTASSLQATNVQAAIDEIVGILANVLELNTGS